MNKIILLISVFIFSASSLALSAEWVVRDAKIMGTTIHTEVWHEDITIAQQAAELVLKTMDEVNQSMSPYLESSELSLVNRDASSKVIQISSELFSVINQSLAYSVKTAGAFDITYASVGYLYNYRKSIRPNQTQLEEQLTGVNFRFIDLNKSDQTIHYKHKGVRIDLGGIAKGYAVDLAVERAKKLGIEHISVTAGGDTRILGDRLGRPWVIGIRHPMNKDKVIAKIPLVNEALSTSGDYERYFDEDGVRYHHIIDPKTGDSARTVRSVTILGPKAIDTDALSTSVFVMGSIKGLQLLESLDKIEGIIVDKNGNLLFSSGLQNLD
ncbi:MAG: FAD:protein FMN transferase [Gammaproteobacteria bacterium]|nr:FAD:protein FMN transferase [Gammaproteobacteria bacterium]